MDSYDLFATLYDLEHQDFAEDIELYHNYAVRCGGLVLELGCGTGRVCLALAQAGLDVVGVDNSPAMLALARAHAADAGLSGQVELQLADVRTLDLERQFALAIYPLNGFLHLLTVADQLAVLRNVSRALLPGGLLILDLPNPHTVFNPNTDGLLALRSHFQSPEGHRISSFAVAHTDPVQQIQHLTLLYDQAEEGRALHRTVVETDLRFVYRYEMEHLLQQAGLEVDRAHGSYDLDPYQADSAIMLFVAHKPSQPRP
jgi:SAM-dependent methyltransferase